MSSVIKCLVIFSIVLDYVFCDYENDQRYGEIYKVCGDTFVRTCSDPYPEADTDPFACGPSGWYCKDDYVRDETGRCVPIAGCKCGPNERLIIKCKKMLLTEDENCEYTCKCKPGYLKVDGTCIIQVCPAHCCRNTTTVSKPKPKPKPPVFQSNQKSARKPTTNSSTTSYKTSTTRTTIKHSVKPNRFKGTTSSKVKTSHTPNISRKTTVTKPYSLTTRNKSFTPKPTTIQSKHTTPRKPIKKTTNNPTTKIVISEKPFTKHSLPTRPPTKPTTKVPKHSPTNSEPKTSFNTHTTKNLTPETTKTKQYPKYITPMKQTKSTTKPGTSNTPISKRQHKHTKNLVTRNDPVRKDRILRSNEIITNEETLEINPDITTESLMTSTMMEGDTNETSIKCKKELLHACATKNVSASFLCDAILKCCCPSCRVAPQPGHCPLYEHYEAKAPYCQKTCQNSKCMIPCNGCVCDNGYIRDEITHACVPHCPLTGAETNERFEYYSFERTCEQPLGENAALRKMGPGYYCINDYYRKGPSRSCVPLRECPTLSI